MKRFFIFLGIVSIGLCVGTTPVLAQHGHAGTAPGGPGMASSHVPGGHDTGQPSGNANTTAPGPKSPTDMLTSNTKLNGALTSSLTKKGVLPQGTTLADDCNGFKNLGQCVAALHVSHNLGNVNFFCLRQAMTGVAPPSGSGATCSTSGTMSLGKAITTLSPNANAKSEAKQGTHQANSDIKEAASNS